MRSDHKMTAKRKISMLSVILCFSMVFSLVSTLFVQQVDAKTSRIAMIQEISGTVTVKKAGGSKEFRAYKNMKLNHGDHISTQAKSSVVLSIVDRKDEVTIGEKSDLYISNLQDQSGNKKTNFSMWGGSMWVKASSLVNSEDEFEIETPTSIMGVRGTNFFTGVNPETGDSTFFIASGVGAVQKKGEVIQPLITVNPLQQINIYESTPNNEMDNSTHFVDIDSLINKTDGSIIEAIIKNKQTMDQENEEYIEKLKQQNQSGIQETSKTDLDRITQNLDNLVGNVVKTAIDKSKVDEDKINELINQINQQIDKKLDLITVNPLVLSEAEKLKQAQIKLLEEQRKQKLEQERQRQEELKRQNEELLKKLQEQKKQQQQANEEAQKKAKELAEQKHLASLSELQKQRFEEEKRRLMEAIQAVADAAVQAPVQVPTSPPTGGDSGGSVSPNTPPTVVQQVYNTWAHLDETIIIELGSVFADSDLDTLTYTSSSDNENIAIANVIGSNLHVVPVEGTFGVVNVTINANDGRGGSANTSFDIYLYPPLDEVGTETRGPNYFHLTFRSYLEDSPTYNVYVNNSTEPVLSTSNTYGDLMDLIPNTSYDIRIVALGYENQIIAFSELNVTTLDFDIISGLTSIGVTEQSITVTWDSFFTEEDIGSYRIELNGEEVDDFAQNITDYTVEGLDFNTQYVIRITAWYNGSDFADAVATITVTTQPQPD